MQLLQKIKTLTDASRRKDHALRGRAKFFDEDFQGNFQFELKTLKMCFKFLQSYILSAHTYNF